MGGCDIRLPCFACAGRLFLPGRHGCAGGDISVGSKVFGSTRWIKVAGFTLQTSEFVKIVLILLVARYLTDIKAGANARIGKIWRNWARLVGIPMLLVMKQPDLGTSLTYIPILVCGVLMAGLRWKYLVVIAAISISHFADRLSFS